MVAEQVRVSTGRGIVPRGPCVYLTFRCRNAARRAGCRPAFCFASRRASDERGGGKTADRSPRLAVALACVQRPHREIRRSGIPVNFAVLTGHWQGRDSQTTGENNHATTLHTEGNRGAA